MNIINKIIVILFLILLISLLGINREEIYETKHIRILRKTASECTLFLKRNDQFPLNKPCDVLLIGSGARNTLEGGLGSGSVESRYFTTCEDGLENAGFKITSKEWLNQYPHLKEEKIKEHLDYIKNMFKIHKSQSFISVSFPEYEYNLKLNDNEKKADLAIYVLARNSGEGIDRRPIKGDIFLTETEIKDILYLNEKYKKFILVLNVCGYVDLSPVKEVSNILLLSQLGVVTGDILADIILGKQNPIGKLATTWAKFKDYKFFNEYIQFDDVNYLEGIYVGYRYFNSVGVKPLFPFGFGLSYTSFDISKISLTNKKEKIYIKVKVKNIGKFKGKEVIQIYVSPSQENIDKPYQALVAFKKTPLLDPLNDIEINLHFRLRKVARYDSNNECYTLDKGKYLIRVGNSSEHTKIYGYIKLDEDIITEELKNINDEKLDFKDFKPEITLNEDLSDVQKIELKKEDFRLKKIKYNYKHSINEKLSKLSNENLANLCVGANGNEKIRGIVGLTRKNINNHYLKMADGPAGLRLSRVYNIDSKGSFHRLSKNSLITSSYTYYLKHKNISLSYQKIKKDFSKYPKVVYQNATTLPIATALAQTFNTDLMGKYGNIIGKEMEIFDIQLWLAPAMNIHRNILCGRNFEYFSEDPLVTGKIAAAIIKGVQSHKNTGATIKHFAANNQENKRMLSNSKISERALREIYLKGFQIAIEKSHPYAIMTSYNLLNGLHTSENKKLLVNVLRNEWNFKGLIMTDWSVSSKPNVNISKNAPQNAFNIIKGRNNLMMPGSKKEYNILMQKLNKNLLTRNDLLICASKVYKTIELLNK